MLNTVRVKPKGDFKYYVESLNSNKVFGFNSLWAIIKEFNLNSRKVIAGYKDKHFISHTTYERFIISNSYKKLGERRERAYKSLFETLNVYEEDTLLKTFVISSSHKTLGINPDHIYEGRTLVFDNKQCEISKIKPFSINIPEKTPKHRCSNLIALPCLVIPEILMAKINKRVSTRFKGITMGG